MHGVLHERQNRTDDGKRRGKKGQHECEQCRADDESSQRRDDEVGKERVDRDAPKVVHDERQGEELCREGKCCQRPQPQFYLLDAENEGMAFVVCFG